MNWKEEWDFAKWECRRIFLGDSPQKGNRLWNIITLTGSFLCIAGIVIFLTAEQFGTSSYDYTKKLDTPMPMVGQKTVLAENDRVYVFSEHLCAVNG